MRIVGWILGAFSLLAAVASAQPVVGQGGVINAASYGLDGMPNGGVAQGSMFLVYGDKMGPATYVQATPPLQKTFNGTSVKVTSGGTTVDAYIYATSAGRLTVVLPSTTPVGAATLTVTYNSQTSAPVTFQVVKSNPGIFSQNQAGSGPGSVQNFVTQTSTPLNTLTFPAQPNQYLVIWGTGMGAADFDDGNYPVAKDLPFNVAIWVGNKLASVKYHGRSPYFPGVDQINVQLAGDTPMGCYVPLVETVTDTSGKVVVSNYTTIAVAGSGSPCSDSNGFSANDLTLAQANGKFRQGRVSLSRTITNISYSGLSAQLKADKGSGTFVSYTLDQLTSSQGLGQTTTIGTCSVWTFSGQTGVTDPILPIGLDAGTVINVQGPQGAKQMTTSATTTGSYSATFANATVIPGLTVPGLGTPYLEKGTYTIDNGSGGKDVGAFKFTLNLPDPLVWSNQDSIASVTRAQGVTVNWTGGDASSYVKITGFSSMSVPQVTGVFTCTAPASALTFTVPAVVTLALPASSSSSGTPIGLLSVGNSGTPVRFSATGIDAGYGSFSYENSKTVGYQ